MTSLNKTNCNLILMFIVSLAFLTSIHLVFAITVLMLAIHIVIKKHFDPDIGDVIIFLAMFSWKIFSSHSVSESLIYGLGYTAVYQIGKIIVHTSDNSNANISAISMVTIAGFSFIKALANYSYLLFNPNAIKIEKWPNWRGTVIPRTQHEFFLIMMGSLIFFFFISSFLSHRIYLIGLALSLLAISIGVLSSGRLTFFCSLLATIAAGTGYTIENRLYKTRIFKTSIIVMALFIAIFSVSMMFNIGGIYDAYLSSMWAGSGGLIHNTRFTLMTDSIKQLHDYPFGGNKNMLTEYNGTMTPFAHNTWLDIGKSGGIIPLLLTVLFTIYNTICMFRIWFTKREITKYALITGFIGMSLYHMTEPAIISDPLFWAVEVYIGGMLSELAF